MDQNVQKINLKYVKSAIKKKRAFFILLFLSFEERQSLEFLCTREIFQNNYFYISLNNKEYADLMCIQNYIIL